MAQSVLVVDNPSRWHLEIPDVEIVAARTYLSDPGQAARRNCRVYNLCRSYRYQSLGYYVSLLAEARGHRPIPRVSTIQDLRYQSVFKVVSEDLDDLIQTSLAPLHGDSFTLSIYFSRNMARRYDRLCRLLFNLFPVPLLRARFTRDEDGWTLRSLSPIAASEIPEGHRDAVVEFARAWFTGGRPATPRRKPPRFHLAILTDSSDATPPSNPKAIRRFIASAESLGIGTEIIDRDDYGRLGEFDALFIRQTTAVNNATYRFARRAEAEGLVVIDDPISIVRCTNKVYLAELLSRHRIPAPRTEIVHRQNLDTLAQSLSWPCILKEPDSSFSLGVVKIDSAEEFLATADRLLEKSEMLIAQEFIRTDFDWRIGIIDQKPLYACKYFMARSHWQIYNNKARDTSDFTGDAETLPVELAPRPVVRAALKAANAIGDGLYGVDLKERDGQVYLIEVNDNPSIDAGVEDKVLRETLYDRIMEVFLRRLESRRESRDR